MKELRIAWLFPDTLYLHGERGNILALQRISAMKGLEASVDKIDFDTEDFDPMDYDIIFCPPGEIVSFPVVILSPSITGWLIVWVVFPSLLYNAREIFPSPSVLLPRVTAAIHVLSVTVPLTLVVCT